MLHDVGTAAETGETILGYALEGSRTLMKKTGICPRAKNVQALTTRLQMDLALMLQETMKSRRALNLYVSRGNQLLKYDR
jgi:hypothetical protein